MTWIKSEQASKEEQSEYLRPTYEHFFQKLFAHLHPIIQCHVLLNTPSKENFTVKVDLKNLDLIQ